MRKILKSIKRALAAVLKRVIVSFPLPLSLQTWAIKWLLPMDPWPKSLVYQQCLANRVIRSRGAIVQNGPFKGMVCIRDADEGCLVPKLLGCYEEELVPAVETFIRKGCDRIMDVGCASGYWLTGLALRMPRAQVFGFDIDEEALERCSKLLALNNVQSRVKLLGLCNPERLEKLINGRTLLFMDCDGPEYDLLDPQLAPALRKADIIVEIHDFINPSISSTLYERFRESHAIERISSRTREPASERYPGLKALPREHWPAALDERRPCVQEWMIMRSRVLNPQTEVSIAAGSALS
ncbi:MAG TPA: class I SAM-dependent methyltransferase [Terrimicrobiaceae bacterium]